MGVGAIGRVADGRGIVIPGRVGEGRGVGGSDGGAGRGDGDGRVGMGLPVFGGGGGGVRGPGAVELWLASGGCVGGEAVGLGVARGRSVRRPAIGLVFLRLGKWILLWPLLSGRAGGTEWHAWESSRHVICIVADHGRDAAEELVTVFPGAGGGDGFLGHLVEPADDFLGVGEDVLRLVRHVFRAEEEFHD